MSFLRSEIKLQSAFPKTKKMCEILPRFIKKIADIILSSLSTFPAANFEQISSNIHMFC